jgi:hypothetical protein
MTPDGSSKVDRHAVAARALIAGVFPVLELPLIAGRRDDACGAEIRALVRSLSYAGN